MYALKLKVFAETEPFQGTEWSCGRSKDGTILGVLFYQLDQSYGYNYYHYYLGIYLVKEKEIVAHKVLLSSSQSFGHGFQNCLINHYGDQIKIYLQVGSSKIRTIIMSQDDLEGEPIIQEQQFTGEIKDSILDTQTDEIYLLFENHIENLPGSLKIIHNQALQNTGNLYFYLVTQSNLPNFMIFKEYIVTFEDLLGQGRGKKETIEVINVDWQGKVTRKLLQDQQISIISSLQNGQNDLIYYRGRSENGTIEGIFIDPNLNFLQASLTIDSVEYQFLNFGQKENHIFVYDLKQCSGEDPCYKICYCKYEVQADKLEVEEVIDCYSKGITTLNGTFRDFETPDGEQYFLFGDIFINAKRKDGDLDAQQNLSLYFPNAAYDYQHSVSSKFFIFPKDNFQSDGILEIQKTYYSQYDSYYTQRIVLEDLQVAMHPGVIAGFVFLGIFVVILTVLLGYAIYRYCNCVQIYRYRRRQEQKDRKIQERVKRFREAIQKADNKINNAYVTPKVCESQNVADAQIADAKTSGTPFRASPYFKKRFLEKYSANIPNENLQPSSYFNSQQTNYESRATATRNGMDLYFQKHQHDQVKKKDEDGKPQYHQDQAKRQYDNTKPVIKNFRIHAQPSKKKQMKVQEDSVSNLAAKHQLEEKPIPGQMKKMAKRLGQQEKCCICLDIGCNTYLPCLHFYHQNCIVQWLGKLAHCPLCHDEARKSDIVKFQ